MNVRATPVEQTRTVQMYWVHTPVEILLVRKDLRGLGTTVLVSTSCEYMRSVI